MNWNQLHYIVAIAEEKSITKAAEKLYISQPSLSLSLRSLEEELGTPLFERSHGALTPTYAGTLFCQWAASTLHSKQQLSSRINDISQQTRQLIQIGIGPYRSSIILPKVLETFFRTYPRCEVRIAEHPTYILKKMLENNEIDLMIDVPNPDTVNYENEFLAREKILLAIPSSFLEHRIKPKENGRIALEDTISLPYIMLSPSHVMGRLSQKICDSFLFHPDVRLTCVHIETVLLLVKQQLGVAFVPEMLARQESSPSEVRYFSIDQLEEARQVCLIYPKKKYLSTQLLFLLELLREAVPLYF